MNSEYSYALAAIESGFENYEVTLDRQGWNIFIQTKKFNFRFPDINDFEAVRDNLIYGKYTYYYWNASELI